MQIKTTTPFHFPFHLPCSRSGLSCWVLASLGGLLCVCPSGISDHELSAANAMPFKQLSVCTQALLCFLPHSFTLANFPSSLCLFMAHSLGRSYFHRLMHCVQLAKAIQHVWESSFPFLCLCLEAYCLLPLTPAAKSRLKL